ncbi:hypothetical protein ACQCX2_01535 [Propionibacteriaceae bacterium Y1700]|uniref:hypothetical protein n=1 Tax=Microlunatus sp. Y1700 TaxID=3418487 RepID=UPI003DA7092A
MAEPQPSTLAHIRQQALRLARQCARDTGAGADHVRPFHLSLAWLQCGRAELAGMLSGVEEPRPSTPHRRELVSQGVNLDALHRRLAESHREDYRSTLRLAGVDPDVAGAVAAQLWDAVDSAPLDAATAERWRVSAQSTMSVLDLAAEFTRTDQVRLRAATPLLPMLRALAEIREPTLARVSRLAGGDVEVMARRLSGVHRRRTRRSRLADRFTVQEVLLDEPPVTRYRLHDVEQGAAVVGEVQHGVALATMPVRERFCEAVARWAGVGVHPTVLDCLGGRDVDGSILIVTDPWDRTLAETMADPNAGPDGVNTMIKIAQLVADALHHLHTSGLAHGAVSAEAVVLTGDDPLSARLRAPGLAAAVASLTTTRVPSEADDIRQWGIFVRQLVGGRPVPATLSALLDHTTGPQPIPLVAILDQLDTLTSVDRTAPPGPSPTPQSLVAEALTRESFGDPGGARMMLLEAPGAAAADPYVLMHGARLLDDAEAGRELLEDGLAEVTARGDHQLVRAGLAHARNHPHEADDQLGPVAAGAPPLAAALRNAIDAALEGTEEFDLDLDEDLTVAAVSADGGVLAGIVSDPDHDAQPMVIIADLVLRNVQQHPISVGAPEPGAPFAVSNTGCEVACCTEGGRVLVIDPLRGGAQLQTHDLDDQLLHLQFDRDQLIAITGSGTVHRLGFRPPVRPDLQPRTVPPPARATTPEDLRP